MISYPQTLQRSINRIHTQHAVCAQELIVAAPCDTYRTDTLCDLLIEPEIFRVADC